MKLRFTKAWRREAGDTLIEVTMALTILSMVLISSTVIATKAYRGGQTARERTTMAMASQGQMEAVRAFRDNNNWDIFLNGKVSSPTPPGSVSADARPFRGVLNASTTGSCHVVSPCLHMDPVQAATYLPTGGALSGPISTSYIEMTARAIDPGASPNNIEITVNYGFEGLGGSEFRGHIKTSFTNIGAKPIAPPPPVALPCTGGPIDIIFIFDRSGSMKDDWDNGLTRFEEGQKVANAFVDAAGISAAGNHMSLIEFSDTATVLSGLTGSVPALKSAISALDPTGGTRYIFPLMEAAKQLKTVRPGAKSAVVFMSDGQDGDNDYDQQLNTPLIHKAVKDNTPTVAVYTIGINPGNEDLSLLENMPQNGGFYTNAQSTGALDQAFVNIAGALTCN